jgi:hypothetical protein
MITRTGLIVVSALLAAAVLLMVFAQVRGFRLSHLSSKRRGRTRQASGCFVFKIL